MGTSRSCEINQQVRGFVCGPIASGDTVSYSVRATPDSIGVFSYAARFYDRSAGTPQEIKSTDGTELLVTWTETVTPVGQRN
jgi:hypothetical protein